MTKENDWRSNSESLVDKIEDQLADILAKKKEEVTRALEEKIQREKEEAQRMIQEIEQEYSQEKDKLSSYHTLFAELETKRSQLKAQIKEHLDRATSYQDEIVALTGKTLEELKTVSDINEQMEEFKNDAQDRLSSVRHGIEEKFGITAAIQEDAPADDLKFDLDEELSKLTRIKEILGDEGAVEPEEADIGSLISVPDESPGITPQFVQSATPFPSEPDEAPVSEPGGEQSFVPPAVEDTEPLPQLKPEMEIEVEEPEFTPHIKETQEAMAEFESKTDTTAEFESKTEATITSPPEIERMPEFIPSSITEEDQPGGLKEESLPDLEPLEPSTPGVVEELPELDPTPPVEFVQEEISPEAEPGAFPEASDAQEVEPFPAPTAPIDEVPSREDLQADTNFEMVFEELEKYRKGNCADDNGDVSYFQKNGRIIVDGECLVSTINNSIEGAKKLYDKLTETESPKEQFFIKQDIIRYQEVLRKLMLVAIRMCEKESCTLPRYTQEILNVDILRNILEKVSMENWSDQNDFSSFDDYAKSLKDAYYARITPPAVYLKSIIEELQTG